MAEKFVFSFHQVFAAEIAAINARRDRMARPPEEPDALARQEPTQRHVAVNAEQRGNGRGTDSAAAVDKHDREGVVVRTSGADDLAGLAFSGGGIRSAAICLGVAQALDALDARGGRSLFDRLDYLSSVSGGGYVATSIVASMSRNGGSFPFRSRLDQQETAALKHLRNYSNYLLPNGLRDVVINLIAVLRGLATNAVIILPILLALALFTAISNPTYADLKLADIAGWRSFFGLRFTFEPLFGLESFHFTSYLVPLAILFLVLQTLAISMRWTVSTLTKRQMGSATVAGLAAFVAFVAFCEFQTFVLKAMFALDPAYAQKTIEYEKALAAAADIPQTRTMAHAGLLSPLVTLLQHAGQALLPVALALLAFGRWLVKLLDVTNMREDWRAVALRVASRAALYLAALVVFVLLWFVYLLLAYWAIDARAEPDFGPVLAHVPGWLQSAASPPAVGRLAGLIGLGQNAPVAQLYGLTTIALFSLWAFIGPNANSLHRLYRDRLSQAFVFDPRSPDRRIEGTEDPDRLRFSTLDTAKSPYLLANTAINLQRSAYLKRRGRRADFFLFSPLFIGSEATGYAKSSRVEDIDPVTLPTAMAISGAAASSHMGANNFGPLSFALAVLNVRLGYWLTNPAKAVSFSTRLLTRRLAQIGPIYFLKELFGMLREDSLNVYLTDGGHIENLGVYELLRRRCRIVIAVDAEADPAMAFPALVRLQRMARIDMGVRIHLDWRGIAEATRRIGDPTALKPSDPDAAPKTNGPHAAFGVIEYQEGPPGVLFYVKSSLTGDENDYVRDYKRRYPAFPHEATADQFFSEEQFEVYRALGFHMARGAFTGRDEIGLPSASENPSFAMRLQEAFAQLGLTLPEGVARRLRERGFQEIA